MPYGKNSEHTKTIRLFLVDDHVVVRTALKLLIEAEPDMTVVGEAPDGVAAFEQMKMCTPDVAIIDLTMPRMGGADLTNKVKRDLPEVKVLILTMHDTVENVTRLLNAGAVGYISKQATATQLIQAIRTVAADTIYLDPTLTSAVVTEFMQSTTTPSKHRSTGLSTRECEVLSLVARGYSTKEIASQLGISAKSIETYKSRSMDKTGLHNRVDIVRFALEQGWLKKNLN